ncbi:hypothetical protein HDC90_001869 [Pedobacter sp. AK013]|nr:hypothetical protein [Pedobacter sp. AK013]
MGKVDQNDNRLEMRRKFFQPFCSVNRIPKFDSVIKYPCKKKAGLNPAQNLLGKN